MIHIFVGNSCSGKTEAAKYLSKKINMPHFEASRFMKVIKEKFPDRSIESLCEEFGRDMVASNMIKDNPNIDPAAISGFRTSEEIKCIKGLGESLVIGIYASDRLCFIRNKLRNRPDNLRTFEDFYRKKICADYALGLGSIMQNDLDVLIENESSDKKNLYAALDRLLRLEK